MKIVGHRGAAGLAPENTLAAIRAGLKAGVDWIEFDVHSTKDGRVVLMHDSSLRRMTGARKQIKKLTYQELRKHRINGHHIPTIAEALNAVDGQAKVVIEIKSPGCAETVVGAIEQRVRSGDKYGNYMVGSFKPRLLREVRWLNDKIKLVLFHSINPYKFLNVKNLPLDAAGFHHRLMPKGVIRQAKLHGLDVYVYTVNSARRARRMAELGVDNLATNQPDLIKSSR